MTQSERSRSLARGLLARRHPWNASLHHRNKPSLECVFPQFVAFSSHRLLTFGRFQNWTPTNMPTGTRLLELRQLGRVCRFIYRFRARDFDGHDTWSFASWGSTKNTCHLHVARMNLSERASKPELQVIGCWRFSLVRSVRTFCRSVSFQITIAGTSWISSAMKSFIWFSDWYPF